jgi:hypothetical protein
MRVLLVVTALFLSSLCFARALAEGSAPARETSKASEHAEHSPVIVIGFLGGYVRSDNTLHAEVQLAARIRSEYPANTYSEIFENHRGDDAYAEILRLLDADHDGSLSPEEKSGAQIILYGHSWGGSELVTLARELQQESIPVLLTIQVDSIQKRKEDDGLIPANVAEAANFYQPDSVLHGRTEIRAADPSHTKILGNFRFEYKQNPISCADGFPWLVRHFAKPHAEIECDPNVWNKIEALIRTKLPSAPGAANKLATIESAK